MIARPLAGGGETVTRRIACLDERNWVGRMHSIEWTTAGPKVVSNALLSTGDFDAVAAELKPNGIASQRARKVALVAARRNVAGQPGRKEGDWTVTSISRDGSILPNKQGAADAYQVSDVYFTQNYEKDEGSHEAGE